MKLSEGDKAPLFEGLNQDGKNIRLQDYKGKKVVIYFYPKDMTPGCTAEACSLRDDYGELQSAGYYIIGISADTVKKHKQFADKYELPFDLIADTDKKIIESYGVWGPKKFMGREFDGIIRSTFIIDEKGKIERIIEKVVTKNHGQQIMNLWKTAAGLRCFAAEYWRFSQPNNGGFPSQIYGDNPSQIMVIVRAE